MLGLLAVLWSLCATHAAALCPRGWVADTTRGACFRFVDQRGPWSEALSTCLGVAGRVVVVSPYVPTTFLSSVSGYEEAWVLLANWNNTQPGMQSPPTDATGRRLCFTLLPSGVTKQTDCLASYPVLCQTLAIDASTPTLGGWSDWSVCSGTCGVGVQTRRVNCTNCTSNLIESRQCEGPPCPDADPCAAIPFCTNQTACNGSQPIPCRSCSNGFYLGQSRRSCLACPPVAHCAQSTCTGAHQPHCVTCEQGYFFSFSADPDTMCRKCPPIIGCSGPISCTDVSSALCPKCSPGYFLADGGRSCKGCGPGCLSCSGATSCQLCADGYRQANGHCVCPAGRLPTQDGCTACPPTTCAAGLQAVCRSPNDVRCLALCLKPTQWLDTDTSPATCRNCSVCRPGFFVYHPCTETQDTKCVACPPQRGCNSNSTVCTGPDNPTCTSSCLPGYFAQNRTCKACTPSTQCQTVAQPCTPTSDLVCAKCPPQWTGPKCDIAVVELSLSPQTPVPNNATLTATMAATLHIPPSSVRVLSINQTANTALLGVPETSANHLIVLVATGNQAALSPLVVLSVSQPGQPTVFFPDQTGPLPPSTPVPSSTPVAETAPQTGTPDPSSSGLPIGIILGIAAGGLCVVLLVGALGVYAYVQARKRRRGDFKAGQSAAPLEGTGSAANEMQEFRAEVELVRARSIRRSKSTNLPAIPQTLFPYLNDSEALAIRERLRLSASRISRSHFVKLRRIGAGHFSSVYQGVIVDTSTGRYVAVAIKELKEVNEDEVAKFVAEAELMRQLSHPNIVGCLGLGEDAEGCLPCLLMELMPRGNLHACLRRRREHSESMEHRERLWYAHQMARGMAYLAGEGIVHRDLAARNCMLGDPTPQSDGYPVAKLCDFGLSRKVELTKDYYRMEGPGLIPIRWLPPEALITKRYTEASDVWGYGVVLWEIWTMGRTPYEDVHLFTLLSSLQNGMRLPQPDGCPNDVYSVMLSCWHPDPTQRPVFSELTVTIGALYQRAGGTVTPTQWRLTRAGSSSQPPLPTIRAGIEGYDVIGHATPNTARV